MKSFADKVGGVTGAGSGIGHALAVALNQAGAHLALCDLDQSGLEEAQDLLENKDLRVSLHVVDVSNRRQRACALGGPFDGIVRYTSPCDDRASWGRENQYH